jgi:hypothetical protein
MILADRLSYICEIQSNYNSSARYLSWSCKLSSCHALQNSCTLSYVKCTVESLLWFPAMSFVTFSGCPLLDEIHLQIVFDSFHFF